jgi:hypothetical protein
MVLLASIVNTSTNTFDSVEIEVSLLDLDGRLIEQTDTDITGPIAPSATNHFKAEFLNFDDAWDPEAVASHSLRITEAKVAK